MGDVPSRTKTADEVYEVMLKPILDKLGKDMNKYLDERMQESLLQTASIHDIERYMGLCPRKPLRFTR